MNIYSVPFIHIHSEMLILPLFCGLMQTLNKATSALWCHKGAHKTTQSSLFHSLTHAPFLTLSLSISDYDFQKDVWYLAVILTYTTYASSLWQLIPSLYINVHYAISLDKWSQCSAVSLYWIPANVARVYKLEMRVKHTNVGGWVELHIILEPSSRGHWTCARCTLYGSSFFKVDT